MNDKMAGREVKLIESIKKQGRDDNMMELLKNAFKRHSVEEIADFLDIGVNEVSRYLEM